MLRSSDMNVVVDFYYPRLEAVGHGIMGCINYIVSNKQAAVSADCFDKL